jgi:hypothetical protein
LQRNEKNGRNEKKKETGLMLETHTYTEEYGGRKEKGKGEAGEERKHKTSDASFLNPFFLLIIKMK